MNATNEARRRFLSCFSGIGLSGTLLPGVLWAQVQQSGAQQVTQEMLKDALTVSGLSFPEEDQKAMLQSVNQNLTKFEEIRNLHIPNDVSPPFHFSPLVPGMKVNRTRQPIRISAPEIGR